MIQVLIEQYSLPAQENQSISEDDMSSQDELNLSEPFEMFPGTGCVHHDRGMIW